MNEIDSILQCHAEDIEGTDFSFISHPMLLDTIWTCSVLIPITKRGELVEITTEGKDIDQAVEYLIEYLEGF